MLGNEILNEIYEVLKQIDHKQIDELIHTIMKDTKTRIFVTGCGRTGYIMRSFAMRLNHLGLTTYFVGDTVTAEAGQGDILIIGSGSGETDSLICYSKKAKELGMKCILFSTRKSNTLAEMADITVVLQSGSKYELLNRKDSIQPMGALFEQSLMILLDSIVLEIMRAYQISNETMFSRHANLE